jgi:hypothetical protein
MKKSLFISLFISSFIQADTYLFCKADKTLNPDFDRIEYSAVHIFKSNVENSGYCHTELTYTPYEFQPYLRTTISAKLGKGRHCQSSGWRQGVQRNADSYDWSSARDLYTAGYLSGLYKDSTYGWSDTSDRSLDRTSLILTERWITKFSTPRVSKELKSQCEIVKSWGDLKKRFKVASKELIELQVKVNERIKEEESSRDKSENQKL